MTTISIKPVQDQIIIAHFPCPATMAKVGFVIYKSIAVMLGKPGQSNDVIVLITKQNDGLKN